MNTPFRPKESGSLSVTSASDRVSLGTYFGKGENYPQFRIYNNGSVPIYLAFGDATVTAAVTDMILPPGVLEVISVDKQATQAYVAAITASGTSTLNFTVGGGI